MHMHWRGGTFISFAAITALLVLINIAIAEQPPSGGFQFANEEVSASTNLHYTGKYCSECHEKTPVQGDGAFLKFNGEFTQLCRCHGYTPATYIHPVDIVPSKEKREKMPRDFPLLNGKIACSTCHDIYRQCQEDREMTEADKQEKRFYRVRALFLRGEAAQNRTDICFKCHEEKQYRKLNPHEQLTGKGEIVPEMCLYCHLEKPDEKTAGYKEVKLIGDLKVLCQRCHGPMERHPAGIDHYRVPSVRMYVRMQALKDEFNAELPLDNEDRLTCITCHNPHAKGVIPEYRPGSKGAGASRRHRLPKILCAACHDML